MLLFPIANPKALFSHISIQDKNVTFWLRDEKNSISLQLAFPKFTKKLDNI